MFSDQDRDEQDGATDGQDGRERIAGRRRMLTSGDRHEHDAATARKIGRQAPSRGRSGDRPSGAIGLGRRSSADPLLGDPIAPRHEPTKAPPPTASDGEVDRIRQTAGEARPAEVREVKRRQHPGDRSEGVREGRHRRPQPAEDRQRDSS